MNAPSTYLAWEVELEGHLSVTMLQVGKATRVCWWNSFWLESRPNVRAKGVVSKIQPWPEHCLSFVDPGALLIVHPGAESKMNKIDSSEVDGAASAVHWCERRIVLKRQSACALLLVEGHAEVCEKTSSSGQKAFDRCHSPSTSPRFTCGRSGMEVVLEAALRDAAVLSEGGASGVIVENIGDAPFSSDQVEPHVVAMLAVVAKAVVQAHGDRLGVNQCS